MSVSVTYKSIVTTEETIDTNTPAVSARFNAITHDGYNSTKVMNASSTPPATKAAYFSKALVAGAATIDLTALTGTNGVTVVGTGLKVQVARFKNPSTNANSIVVTVGASNGYNLAGSDFKVTLAPGQEQTFYGNDATPDVGSGAKNIDISGTGTQALQVSIVLG